MSKCCRIRVGLNRNQWDIVLEPKVFSDLFRANVLYWCRPSVSESKAHSSWSKALISGIQTVCLLCAFCRGLGREFTMPYKSALYVRLHLYLMRLNYWQHELFWGSKEALKNGETKFTFTKKSNYKTLFFMDGWMAMEVLLLNHFGVCRHISISTERMGTKLILIALVIPWLSSSITMRFTSPYQPYRYLLFSAN